MKRTQKPLLVALALGIVMGLLTRYIWPVGILPVHVLLVAGAICFAVSRLIARDLSTEEHRHGPSTTRAALLPAGAIMWQRR